MSAPNRKPHVVIIGGGFGGLEVAKHLSDAPVDITLVDRQNHHLFQPLLYQVATAGLAPEQIATPIRAILRNQSNCRVLLDTACGVDTERRHVHLVSGSRLAYDYLVLAAGARTTFLGQTPWMRHAQGLKSLRDAIHLRERILACFEEANRTDDPQRRERLMTFVVVGAGPLGVEMAGALAELGRYALARDYAHLDAKHVRVVLVEMADRVLPMFDPTLSHHAERQLKELDVEVKTSTKVEDVHSDALVTDAGLLRAEVVCWAPGVEAVELAYAVPGDREKDGRLRVTDDCSLPGHPEAFALGDVASFRPSQDAKPLPALAPVALQQGRHVAATIQRDLKSRSRRAFHYRDKGLLATVGRSRAVAQVGKLKLHGFLAWLTWLAVHLYFLVGFRNRMLVLLDWFWSYITHGRGARVMTDDARSLLQQREVTTHRGGRQAVDESDCGPGKRQQDRAA